MADNQDPHYREIESRGVEPIAVLETVICNGLPAEHHQTAIRNLRICMGLKHLLRVGHKDDVNKELDKAQNYIHRAQNGRWREI